jgi:hypothetical protein
MCARRLGELGKPRRKGKRMFQKHQYSKHLPGLAAAIQSVNNLFNYSGFFPAQLKSTLWGNSAKTNSMTWQWTILLVVRNEARLRLSGQHFFQWSLYTKWLSFILYIYIMGTLKRPHCDLTGMMVHPQKAGPLGFPEWLSWFITKVVRVFGIDMSWYDYITTVNGGY